MKAAGLNTLPYWDFISFDAAIDRVRQNPGRYVVKPSGHAQSEKVLSVVGPGRRRAGPARDSRTLPQGLGQQNQGMLSKWGDLLPALAGNESELSPLRFEAD